MAEPGAGTWSLSESDFKQITQHLTFLLKESSASCAMLVDRTGQLLASSGEQPAFDAMAFASLTAADFSANDQLAKMIGEPDFASLSRSLGVASFGPVTDPTKVGDVLDEAITLVRSGKPAVIDVHTQAR